MSLAVATSAYGQPDDEGILWPANWDEERTAPSAALFTRYSSAELDALPDRFEWLAAGLLADPTYGQAGGEPKTLKSHLANIVGVGVAAGLPILGRFRVAHSRPWLAYAAEGGRVLFTRQLRRIAAAYGVNAADLPIAASFDVALIPSARFRGSLERDLAEIQPGLTTLDPLYAYHGAAVKASNLHEEGELLTTLSTACMAAGSSLLVVNHFNKSGAGNDLGRLTMTGGAEWSDSWLLLSHRVEPDVAGGRFWLRMNVGSRQWGGATYDVDLSIGRFDEERGTHDGDIEWDVRRTETPRATEDQHAATILDILADRPWELTGEQLVTAVGGKAPTVRALVSSLLQAGQITVQPVKRQEGNRHVTRKLYALAREPRPDRGEPWTGLTP